MESSTVVYFKTDIGGRDELRTRFFGGTGRQKYLVSRPRPFVTESKVTWWRVSDAW